MTIKQVPAHKNNYGVGRSGKKIEFIIMHWIVGTLESADATFQKPDRLASSHYGIGDEAIHQYVKESDTAWHASNLDINRRSIGIEHEGGWESPKGSGKRVKPSHKTHETSAKLIAELSKKYNIPLDRKHILRHNEVQGANTQCSGTLDLDLIIELAKKENEPAPTPKFDVNEDLSSEIENDAGLKGYRWYDNHWSLVGLVKFTDSLDRENEKLKSELAESNNRKPTLKEALAVLLSYIGVNNG